MRANNLSSFDQFQRINKDVDLRPIDSQFVAVEALGLHKAIEFLYHEWIVDWSHQLNMSVMADTIIGGEATGGTCTRPIKRRHSHPLVMETIGIWNVQMVEGLQVVDLDYRKLLYFALDEKLKGHA